MSSEPQGVCSPGRCAVLAHTCPWRAQGDESATILLMGRWHQDARIGALALGSSLALAGCLDPRTGGSAASPATEPVAASPAQTIGAVRPRLVLWDGARNYPRNVGVGRSGRLEFWDGGQSWAHCDLWPCKADLAARSGAGVHGRKGLRFHAEGLGWAGSGWSWFGWYPSNAGTDISAYLNLTFAIRVQATSGVAAPDPANVDVSLACSKGKETTARVKVRDYDASFNDGTWHKVGIPIAALTSGDGAAFDPATAWEFRLSTWSATPRDFDIDIDQIAVER